MLQQLIKHYKDKIVTSADKMDANHTVLKTPEGESFAIDLHELTKSEASLLLSLCQYDAPHEPELSVAENKWHQILFHSSSYEDTENYRFLHVFFKQTLVETDALKQAVKGVFAHSSVFVLHPDQRSGVIIELERNGSEEEAYAGFRELVTSDLYMDVQFFAGVWQQEGTDPASVYQNEREAFLSAARVLPPKEMYRLADIVPYLLLKDAALHTNRVLASLLPEDIRQDKELVHSIKVYIESGFNVSVAAKKLYIHRNSLQYRVDRFAERTGVDVKQFCEALPVYFALL